MAGKVIEYIRGSELPPYMIKKFKIDPDRVFKITIEPKDDKAELREAAFRALDEIHEKIGPDDSEEVENIIDEAIKKTRKEAKHHG